MDRRQVLRVLLSAGTPPVDGKSASTTGCPFCGGPVAFDAGLDINRCLKCGAHETAKGWQER